MSCFNDSASAEWRCSLRDSVRNIFTAYICCRLLQSQYYLSVEFWFYTEAGSVDLFCGFNWRLDGVSHVMR